MFVFVSPGRTKKKNAKKKKANKKKTGKTNKTKKEKDEINIIMAWKTITQGNLRKKSMYAIQTTG